jgi:tetratricopeptide (TPR) repeat protein
VSGNQDAERQSGQDVRGGRDAFAAGRDLTVNNYFSGISGQDRPGSASAAPGEAAPAGLAADSQSPGGGVRPIRKAAEWDPLALGVHRAIEVPGGAQDGLPGFVVRPHDHALRAEAASAGEGPKLIMLVGSSSTGKTRSAVEAMRSVLPDWHLLYPMTALELTTLISGHRVRDRMILWLNETQVYLEGSDGADAAASLRGLLASGQPLLAVGTLWPEYWLAYTRPPEFGAPDPHPQARQLLETAVKLDVPDSFTAADLAQARKIAAVDPRLSAALSIEHRHRVTQVLAGGPDLIDRWRNAPNPYCRAVITAAIDARRLGHLSLLPAAMLQAAAAAHLDGPQRAAAQPRWFAEALAYARKTVKGAVAPLTATSESVGQIDGYLVADYLDQHGRAARRRAPVPDSLWEALASHSRTGADLSRLGTAAADRGRYRHAAILWTAAVQAGDTSMTLPLRRLLSHAGHHAQAEQALRRAAAAGDREALTRLAGILEREGRHRELERVLRDAATAGDHQAAHDLAARLSRAGRSSEAVQVIRAAIAAGDRHGQPLLGILVERAPQPEHAGDAGQPDARTTEDAPAVTTPPTADPPAVGRNEAVSGTQQGTGRENTAALPGRRKATPRFHNPKAREPSEAREEASSPAESPGEREGPPHPRGAARREPVVVNASPPAAETAAGYWRRRHAQIERSLRDLTRAGDVDAEREMATFLIAAGRTDEGERLLRAAASTAGDAASLRLLKEVLTQTGRASEAAMLAQYGLNENGTTAPEW